MRVLFDASKLKHPNTGLYHFTLQLATELEKLSEEYSTEIEFLVESTAEELRVLRKRRFRIFGSLLGQSGFGAKVQHNPFQFYKLNKRRGVKQILTIHDLNFMVEKSGAKQQRYLRRLQKEIDKADQVVAISNFTKSEVLKYCDLKGRDIEVIHNGCNIPRVEAEEPKERPTRKFLFGIGTMLEKKNWHTLPCLLVDNDLELVLAGAESQYWETILQEAKRFGVEQRVRLVGAISEGQKCWCLSNCELFVFPSLAEGFGLPVIEAMYYGKRSLISQHGSLREVAGDCANYFDWDFTPELMQRELKEVLQREFSEDDAQRIKQRALSFSWQRAARSYMELYRRFAK